MYPMMKEALRKYILKCHNNEIIYLISDSIRVSLVQIVPKKSGITMVKNDADELEITPRGG